MSSMTRDEFRQRINELINEADQSISLLDVIEVLYSIHHRVTLLHDMEWVSRVRSEIKKPQKE